MPVTAEVVSEKVGTVLIVKTVEGRNFNKMVYQCMQRKNNRNIYQILFFFFFTGFKLLLFLALLSRLRTYLGVYYPYPEFP